MRIITRATRPIAKAIVRAVFIIGILALFACAV